MSRTYRRSFWASKIGKQVETPLDEKKGSYCTTAPDGVAIRIKNERTHKKKFGNALGKMEYDSANLTNNRIRSRMFALDDIRRS